MAEFSAAQAALRESHPLPADFYDWETADQDAYWSARRELLWTRSFGHQRRDDEYRRPTKDLWIVTPEEAASISIGSPVPLDERPVIWMGVRGAQFVDSTRWYYRPNTDHDVTGELVPEPFNPHDDHAIAIDVDGVRAGYVARSYADVMHRHVCTLNQMGLRVLIPVSLHPRQAFGFTGLNAWAAIPTISRLEEAVPSRAEYLDGLGPLWLALGDEIRQRISANRFHLDTELLEEFVRLRSLAPNLGLPDRVLPQAVPRGLELFLEHQRHLVVEEEARRRRVRDARIVEAFRTGARQVDIARDESIASSTVKRVLVAAGIDTRVPVKSAERQRLEVAVMGMHEEGASRQEVADRLDTTPSTVSKILKDAGVDVSSEAGLNDFSRQQMWDRLEACQLAVALQVADKTRRQIADEMGVSDTTVKAYLADGKFYADPASNSDRLEVARVVRRDQMTASQCAGRAERRGISDGNMLDLIGQPWL